MNIKKREETLVFDVPYFFILLSNLFDEGVAFRKGKK